MNLHRNVINFGQICPEEKAFVQICPDVILWVWKFVTLESVDVCVCYVGNWTKSVWTNFGQNFGDLDKFGHRFWGLSSDFGRVFPKRYIIEETRFAIRRI